MDFLVELDIARRIAHIATKFSGQASQRVSLQERRAFETAAAVQAVCDRRSGQVSQKLIYGAWRPISFACSGEIITDTPPLHQLCSEQFFSGGVGGDIVANVLCAMHVWQFETIHWEQCNQPSSRHEQQYHLGRGASDLAVTSEGSASAKQQTAQKAGRGQEYPAGQGYQGGPT